MSSPFPGMDPWLEYPSLWPDVHRNLISVCQELLVPLVAPHFFVRGEERVYIAGGLGYIEPDVTTAVRPAQTALAPAGEAMPHEGQLAPDEPTTFPGEAWLFNLPDRLPVISIPLCLPHSDVSLDLQKALDTVFDRAGYGLSVDYTQPLEPRLSAETGVWAAVTVSSAI